jgi:hypothetical protein
MIGLHVPSDNFETVDLLKELENARSNISEKSRRI